MACARGGRATGSGGEAGREPHLAHGEAAAVADRVGQVLPDDRVTRVQHARPNEKRGDCRLGGARAAVDDLQCDAPLLLGQDGDEDCLGPGLDRDPSAHRAHEAGASPPLAGDKIGMRHHRPPEPRRGPFPRGPFRIGSGKPCHGARKAMHGRREVRRGASVDAVARRGLARHFLEGQFHGPLHRMVGLDIFRSGTEMPRQGEKACMLARTVVVDLAGRTTGADDLPPGVGVVGHLRPAAQVGLAKAKLTQPASDRLGMNMRPVVARAGKRKLRAAKTGSVCRTALQEWQGLDHLAGRAREDDGKGVAPSLYHIAPLVADDGMSRVDAFQHSAAPEFNHRYRRHLPSPLREIPPPGLFPPRGFALRPAYRVDGFPAMPKSAARSGAGPRRAVIAGGNDGATTAEAGYDMTSPILRATGALVLALATTTGALAQVSTNRVAANTDWSVFVEENPKE